MLDTVPHHKEYNNEQTIRSAPKSVNNRKNHRVKSAYRDAMYRPLFLALEALHAAQDSGETSVKWNTPDHPLYPMISLTANQHGHLCTTPVLHEKLSLKEELSTTRSWKQYQQILPHLSQRHRPGHWRELSDRSRLEWFHYTLRQFGNVCAFTLNLSETVENMVRDQKKPADWLSKRIYRELNLALGRRVELWFVFEFTDKKRLHIHGELVVSEDEMERVRKALRHAGGEWTKTRQHQVKIKQAPTVVWSNYCAKHALFWRPSKSRIFFREAPISANWVHAPNSLRRSAYELYTEKRGPVVELLKTLPKQKFDLTISD